MNSNPARPGFVAAAFESVRQSLLRVVHRRLRYAVLAYVALALLAWFGGHAALASGRTEGRQLFCVVAWWLLGTVLMPWGALFVGIQVVHGPIEDRTFQYLFLRPVPRPALLLGQWIAASIVAVVFSVTGACLLFAVVAVRPGLWPDGLDWSLLRTFGMTLAVGSVAYCAVAAFLGAWFRRPLVVGTIFVVGLQTLAANLDVSAGLRRLTILDPLRRLVIAGVEPDPRLAQALWPAERDPRSELVGSPLLDLGVLTIVCLVFAAWIHARTEYDSRERE